MLAETRDAVASLVTEISGLRSASALTETALAAMRADVARVAADADAKVAKALEVVATASKIPGEVSPKFDALEEGLRSITTRLDGIEAASQRPKVRASSERTFDDVIRDNLDKIASLRDDKHGRLFLHAPRIDTRRVGMRDDVVLGSDALGDLVPRAYRPGAPISYLQEDVSLVDVVREAPAMTGDIFYAMRWTEQSQFGFVHNLVNGAIDGTPTPKTDVVLDDTKGFTPGAWVRFLNASTKSLIQRIKLVSLTSTTLTFAANAVTTDIPDNSIALCETIAATAEGDSKPAGYFEAEDLNVTPQVLATLVKLTRQRLASSPSLVGYIREQLVERLRRTKEFHLLYGTGTNKTLHGFMTIATLTTDLWSARTVGSTMADLVRYTASNIASPRSLVAVMHKLDWDALAMAKASDGHYVHNGLAPLKIVDEPGRKAIGPIQVVTTPMILETSGFVADFQAVSELVPKAGMAGFELAYDGSDFSKNQITARYEEMYGHLIMDPTAIRAFSFDSEPPAV
jgi:hypothetical protein